MKAEYINPFLESASIVLEQIANIKAIPGVLGIKDVKFVEKYIWIQIGIDRADGRRYRIWPA